MRIIVPTVGDRLEPDTINSVLGYDHQVRMMNEQDTTAYAALFLELWEAGESWINVEHDIVIHDQVVSQFEECPNLWCGFCYTVGTPPYRLAALGCTRFRAELMAREPDLMQVVAADGTGGLPAADWRRLDVRIMGELKDRGYTRCEEHLPDVAHLHWYPANA